MDRTLHRDMPIAFCISSDDQQCTSNECPTLAPWLLRDLPLFPGGLARGRNKRVPNPKLQH